MIELVVLFVIYRNQVTPRCVRRDDAVTSSDSFPFDSFRQFKIVVPAENLRASTSTESVAG